jgi:cobaltochelatase CobS
MKKLPTVKSINNNDILKTHIRSRKAEGYFSEITGTMIAKAGEPKLVNWILELKEDPAQIIVDYRRNEKAAPVATPAPVAAPVATPAPAPAPVNGANADQVARDLANLLANAGGKDSELRSDVAKISDALDDLAADLNTYKHEQSKNVRNLHIQIADRPKVNAGKVHKSFEDLLITTQCRQHAFLTGAAGSFKTSSAEKVAEVLGLKCSAISVCAQTTASALLGYMSATGSYVETEFRKRYEQGGVFILDEIDNGNANVLAVLNSALANSYCAFPDGMVKRHEDFILVATANTYGTGANAQYVGRNALDAATLDRFNMIEWSYDEELEYSICPTEWCKHVQAIRKSVNNLGIKAVISPRATFNGQKLLDAGMDINKVESQLIWKGMDEAKVEKIKAEYKKLTNKG